MAPFAPDVSKWEPWRPEEVRRRLEGVAATWYVAAGWAIDLFLGEERRPHDDIEIAVPGHRFDEVHEALRELEFFVVGSGLARSLAEQPDLGAHHQTWGRERDTELWRLDVFREQAEGDTWICRRDARIRLQYDDLIEWSRDGIPFARPEVVLLFKAKAARPKDDDDLEAVLPRLGAERRAWLAGAIELVHPRHRWLAKLR